MNWELLKLFLKNYDIQVMRFIEEELKDWKPVGGPSVEMMMKVQVAKWHGKLTGVTA
mgnify:CR=1 FL=1